MGQGINGIDVRQVMREVKENHAKLDACLGHKFDPSGYRLGVKLTCANCGGDMRAEQIRAYAQGFRAAGGNPDSIWPGLLSLAAE